MRAIGCIIVAVLCFSLAACSKQSAFERMTTDEERAFALQIIRAVQAGDAKTVVEHMPQDLAARMEPLVPEMRKILPSNPDATPRLVNARVDLLTAARRIELEYAMDEGTRYALINLIIVRLDKDVFLRGLRVSPLPQPVGAWSPFTLTGKSRGQYVFLVFAALSSATIMFSLYVLYRATDVARKGPWAIGCALGYGQFTMDWSSGAVMFNTASVQLLGVFAKNPGPLAPWYIGFGIPLVAYIFLLRQAHARVRARDGLQ